MNLGQNIKLDNIINLYILYYTYISKKVSSNLLKMPMGVSTFGIPGIINYTISINIL